MTDRTFSIRAGLAASTVTPGRTAPDESRTTPASDACACAMAGSKVTQARTASVCARPGQVVHEHERRQRCRGCIYVLHLRRRTRSGWARAFEHGCGSRPPLNRGATLSGNITGSYPAVPVFWKCQSEESESRRGGIKDGLLRYQPAGDVRLSTVSTE